MVDPKLADLLTSQLFTIGVTIRIKSYFYTKIYNYEKKITNPICTCIDRWGVL